MLFLGKRETLVEAIAEELIRYIAANNLRGGDRLPSERELVYKIGPSEAAFVLESRLPGATE